jgi:CTP-dependent riboflavin kinase
MILSGVAAPGLGKAAQFTELAWVRRQLVAKLDLPPYPGTFNIRLHAPEQIRLWGLLKQSPGVQIDEPAENNCVAVCYPVLINERVRGAILVPGVAGYPPDQVEVVAPESVRAALGARDGDRIMLRVLD